MKLDELAETTLEGVLIPVAWGAAGEVTEIALTTFDEEEYRIDSAAARGWGLDRRLRQQVRIVGVVRGDRMVEVRGVN